MNSFFGDIRYAFRRARNRPGFTAIAVISLALGIGINTGAFSLLNAVVFRKTPLREPDRVAEIMMVDGNRAVGPFSYPDYRDLREQGRAVFSQFSLSGSSGQRMRRKRSSRSSRIAWSMSILNGSGVASAIT